MKKIILMAMLIIGALQADNTVHYDVRDAQNPISKPNHPSTDLY